MTGARDRLREYFTTPLCPSAVVQLSSSYVSAIRVDLKERRIKHHFVLDLPGGLIEPHFDRPNISDANALTGILKDGIKRLHISGKKIACLAPESCFKIFVLPFDSLPASERERQQLILWRVKKQMPVLPEDIRLAYEVRATSSSVKVLAALARTPVVREYESLFGRLNLDIGILTAPSLSLLNLLDWQKGGDLLAVNIEDDSLSLAAVTAAELSLYRLKMFALERTGRRETALQVEAILQEIENTAHFIEDREKRQVRTLWFRSGMKGNQGDVLEALRKELPFDVQPVQVPPSFGLTGEASGFLAPLAGQVPWRRGHDSTEKGGGR